MSEPGHRDFWPVLGAALALVLLAASVIEGCYLAMDAFNLWSMGQCSD